MFQVKVLDQEVLVPEQATYLDAIRLANAETANQALAAVSNGAMVALCDEAKPGQSIVPLTYFDQEGRRTYERSLRFLLIMALRQLYPKAKLRIEHSAGEALYMLLRGAGTLTTALIHRLEKKMRELVAEDLPFEKKLVSREEAMEHFAKTGQYDTVRLLKYRKFSYFRMYTCGEMMEYFYGEMVPSTGYLKVFGLHLMLPGLLLCLPEPENPNVVSAVVNRPKLLRAYADSSRWAQILECENTADLNEIVSRDQIREFIRINEALHENSIAQIAEAFIKSGARLILVAGPSSSGKTTFAQRLSIQLRVRGLKPTAISLDDYYLDRDQILPEENGEVDLEKLETLDVPLFNDHLVRLMQGEEVALPRFDFVTGRRAQSSHTMKIRPEQPIVVEGIHGLNDQLTADVPGDMKFKVYISALTTLNLDDHNRIRTTDVRLLRRMVRDFQFRGTSIEETMGMWKSVRNGEEKYIFPHQENADVMFNSTLVYELSILKKYAYPLLAKIDKTSEHYPLAQRLVKFLNYFLVADAEDEIPPNSILREFIGQSCFHRQEQKR